MSYRLTALVVTVMLVSWGGAQQTLTSTETLETVTVRLEVKAEPDILVSRLNPPLIELSNPFGAGILTATIDGEPYPDDPEFYYARLNPVTWQLAVPQGTPPGSYPADIQSTFALCSKTQGFCFTDEQSALATVQVGGEENETVVVRLREPER